MFDFDALESLDPTEHRIADQAPAAVCVEWQDLQLADLQCKVLIPPGQIRLALFFLHGSGKPFDIEQRIFGPRAESLLSEGVAVVLPASPMKDGKVHFWYSTDTAILVDLLQKASGKVESIEGLSQASGAAESPLDALKDGEPAFMEVSRSAVLAAIKAFNETWQISVEKLALGGFSQGAAIAMDVAFHLLPKVPAAVGFFSGSLMCRQRWRKLVEGQAEKWSSMPLVQSHGTADFAVGVNGGRWMHHFCMDEIQMQKAEYHEFKGGHTIPPDVVDRFVQVLLACAQRPGNMSNFLTCVENANWATDDEHQPDWKNKNRGIEQDDSASQAET